MLNDIDIIILFLTRTAELIAHYFEYTLDVGPDVSKYKIYNLKA